MPTNQGRKTILNNIFKVKSNNSVEEKTISNQLAAETMALITITPFSIVIENDNANANNNDNVNDSDNGNNDNVLKKQLTLGVETIAKKTATAAVVIAGVDNNNNDV